MKKIVLAVLIAFLVFGIVAFIRLYTSTGNVFLNNVNAVNGGNSGSSVNAVSSSGRISLSDLAKHDKESDCWVGYGGKVYDVTSFLPRHPGSAGAISPYCGTSKEFTDAFTKKHGTKKVGALMKVGVLIGDFNIVGTA